MVLLSDLLDRIPLIRGSVYLVEKRTIEGIVMRTSDTEDAGKYYIFIGLSHENDRTAGVVINTKPSDDCVHLCQADYPSLLHYDSHADCTALMKVDRSRLDKYIGAIGEEDLKKIVSALSSSPRVRRAELLAYGIIERAQE